MPAPIHSEPQHTERLNEKTQTQESKRNTDRWRQGARIGQKTAIEKIHDSIEESLAKNKIYGKEAEKLAKEQTQKQMDQLAALHDPDLIVGGNDSISRVGNKNVNSSLGSQ